MFFDGCDFGTGTRDAPMLCWPWNIEPNKPSFMFILPPDIANKPSTASENENMDEKDEKPTTKSIVFDFFH